MPGKRGKTIKPTATPQIIAIKIPTKLMSEFEESECPIGYLNRISLTNGESAVAKKAICIFSEIFFFITMQKSKTPKKGVHIFRKLRPLKACDIINIYPAKVLALARTPLIYIIAFVNKPQMATLNKVLPSPPRAK